MIVYCFIVSLCMRVSVVLCGGPLLFNMRDSGRAEMLTLDSPEPALQTLVLPTKLTLDVN